MTVNHDVVGSSPTGGVIMTRMLRDQHFLFISFTGLFGLSVKSGEAISANISREPVWEATEKVKINKI